MKRNLLAVAVMALALPLSGWAGTVNEDMAVLSQTLAAKDWPTAETQATALLARQDVTTEQASSVAGSLLTAVRVQKKDTASALETGLKIANKELSAQTLPEKRLAVQFHRARLLSEMGPSRAAEAAADWRAAADGYATAAASATNGVVKSWSLMNRSRALRALGDQPNAAAAEDAILEIPEAGNLVATCAIRKSQRMVAAGQVQEAAQLLVDKLAQATSPATLRSARSELNTIATRLNKMLLAKRGESFVGAGKLAAAQALVDAENSGAGMDAALTGLGLKAPADWEKARREVAAQRDAVLEGKLDLPAGLPVRIECFFGVAGAKEFEAKYNGATSGVGK
jgi:hypothetical protein